MIEVFHTAMWCIGLAITLLATIMGLSAFAMMTVDRIVKHFGFWPLFAEALNEMARKRRARNGG